MVGSGLVYSAKDPLRDSLQISVVGALSCCMQFADGCRPKGVCTTLTCVYRAAVYVHRKGWLQLSKNYIHTLAKALWSQYILVWRLPKVFANMSAALRASPCCAEWVILLKIVQKLKSNHIDRFFVFSKCWYHLVTILWVMM